MRTRGKEGRTETSNKRISIWGKPRIRKTRQKQGQRKKDGERRKKKMGEKRAVVKYHVPLERSVKNIRRWGGKIKIL